jgi:hypothetical protein
MQKSVGIERATLCRQLKKLKIKEESTMKSVLKSALALVVLVPSLGMASPIDDVRRDNGNRGGDRREDGRGGGRREEDRTRGDDRRDSRGGDRGRDHGWDHDRDCDRDRDRWDHDHGRNNPPYYPPQPYYPPNPPTPPPYYPPNPNDGYGRIYMDYYQAQDVAQRMYQGAVGRPADSSGLYNMTQALQNVRTVQDLQAICRDFLYKWPEFGQHLYQVGAARVDQDIDQAFNRYYDGNDYRDVDLIQRGQADYVLVDAIRSYIRQ